MSQVSFFSSTKHTIDIVKTKISPKLTLRTVDKSNNTITAADYKPNTLVLLFPWLYARPAAIDKYCDIYHQKKMDVLCIDGELKHFLWPSTGRRFAVEILDYLIKDDHSEHQDRDFLVHAFSIGAYLYSIVLMEMERNPSAYSTVHDKIRGQVFDSITVGGLDRMSEGIAQFTQNIVLQGLLKATTSAYFTVTKKHTVDFYEAAVHQFIFKPLTTPVLFFYCMNDPMASPVAMQEIIDLWRDDKQLEMDVWVKCWEKSSHAGHLRRYPEEYLQSLEDFLVHIGQFQPVVMSKL